MTVAVKQGPSGPIAALRPVFHRNLLRSRLDGAKEDGVGGGLAEFELVTGIELGGTAGLNLDTDPRDPVYHHGAVGGRQVLDVPDILRIAPDVGMTGRNIVADVGDVALPRSQRTDLNALLARLNPARGTHDKAVLYPQQAQGVRRGGLAFARKRRHAQRTRCRRGPTAAAAARPNWNQGGRENKRYRERILRMYSSTSDRQAPRGRREGSSGPAPLPDSG